MDRVAPLDLPVIGISMAGGGLRASIVTAGFLKAFDTREGESTERGIGGLLQSASYLTGLSSVSSLDRTSRLLTVILVSCPDLTKFG